ncbi:MAG: hypothetical protein ACYTFT_15860, partial [Planctomycetota bacterium]
MAKNDDGQLEGIGRSSSSNRGASAYDKWQNYLDQQDMADEQAKLEEMSQRGHVVGEAQPLAGASVELGSAKAIEAAGAAAQIHSPRAQNDRHSMMAAMQAEALSRLDLGAHSDGVNAAVRAADGLDAASQIENTAESHRKHLDGVLLDRAQQLGPDALARPDDYVARAQGPDSRSAEERQEDHDFARQHGLGAEEAQAGIEAHLNAEAAAAGLNADLGALRETSPHAYQLLQELGRGGGNLAALEELSPDDLAAVEKAMRNFLVLTSIVGEDATSVKMAVTVVTDDGGGIGGSAGSEFTIPKEEAAELA